MSIEFIKIDEDGEVIVYVHYVDLNSDLGESFGNYTLGMDSEVLNHVTSANIACGWHAGDPYYGCDCPHV